MKKFDNYKSNLSVLVQADAQDIKNEFIIGGIIDKFFIQFELAWKVLKELLTYEGIAAAQSGSPCTDIRWCRGFHRPVLPQTMRQRPAGPAPGPGTGRAISS